MAGPFQLQRVGAVDAAFYLYTLTGSGQKAEQFRADGSIIEDPVGPRILVDFLGRSFPAAVGGLPAGSRMAKAENKIQTMDFKSGTFSEYTAGGGRVPSSPIYRPDDGKVYWCEVLPDAAPDPYPIRLWKADPDLDPGSVEMVNEVNLVSHGASVFFQEADIEVGTEPTGLGVLLWVKSRVAGITRWWRVYLGYDGVTTDKTVLGDFSPGFDPDAYFRSGWFASGGRTIVQREVPSLEEDVGIDLAVYVNPTSDLTAAPVAWAGGEELVDFVVLPDLDTVWGVNEDEEAIRFNAFGTELERVQLVDSDTPYGIAKL